MSTCRAPGTKEGLRPHGDGHQPPIPRFSESRGSWGEWSLPRESPRLRTHSSHRRPGRACQVEGSAQAKARSLEGVWSSWGLSVASKCVSVGALKLQAGQPGCAGSCCGGGCHPGHVCRDSLWLGPVSSQPLPPQRATVSLPVADGPSANRGRQGHAEWEALLVLRTQHSEPGRGNRSRLMVTAAGSSPKCCHQDIVCLGVGSDFSGFDFLLGRTLRGPQWSSRASPSQGSGASEIRPISATQELRIQVVTMGP